MKNPRLFWYCTGAGVAAAWGGAGVSLVLGGSLVVWIAVVVPVAVLAGLIYGTRVERWITEPLAIIVRRVRR